MQDALLQHYTAEFLDNFLKDLSTRSPMSPLSAIMTNYLYHSEDGTENNRLKVFAAKLYNTIKLLQETPDEVAYGKEDEVNQGVTYKPISVEPEKPKLAPIPTILEFTPLPVNLT